MAKRIPASRYLSALRRLQVKYESNGSQCRETAARFEPDGWVCQQYKAEAHAWECAAAMIEGTLEGMTVYKNS